MINFLCDSLTSNKFTNKEEEELFDKKLYKRAQLIKPGSLFIKPNYLYNLRIDHASKIYVFLQIVNEYTFSIRFSPLSYFLNHVLKKTKNEEWIYYYTWSYNIKYLMSKIFFLDIELTEEDIENQDKIFKFLCENKKGKKMMGSYEYAILEHKKNKQLIENNMGHD